MATVYKYRLKCTTDDKYEYWLLGEDTPPTTCPTNTAHSIDSSSVALVDVIEQNVVTVREETTPTGGKWKGWSFCLHGDTGVSGPSGYYSKTSEDFTWDWPISVLDLQIRNIENSAGDYVQLEVLPPNTGYGEGVIGTLTATAPTGATGISVGQTIIDNVTIADCLSLKEGAKEEDLGEIVSIDDVNNIIYCKNAPATQFTVTSPTFVKFRRYVLKDFILGPPDRYPLGDSKIGGSYVSAGNIVRASYINYGNTEKKVYCIVEYLE